MREQHAREKSVPPVERALKVVGQVERALAALANGSAKRARRADARRQRALRARRARSLAHRVAIGKVAATGGLGLRGLEEREGHSF